MVGPDAELGQERTHLGHCLAAESLEGIEEPGLIGKSGPVLTKLADDHARADVAPPADEWQGETGFIHEAVRRHLRDEQLAGEMDSYSCGPPQMIDSVLPVLQMAGVEPDRIYFDKFTQPTR